MIYVRRIDFAVIVFDLCSLFSHDACTAAEYTAFCTLYLSVLSSLTIVPIRHLSEIN